MASEDKSKLHLLLGIVKPNPDDEPDRTGFFQIHPLAQSLLNKINERKWLEVLSVSPSIRTHLQ